MFQKIDLEPIYHRLKGPSLHSLSEIESLNSFKASFSYTAPFMSVSRFAGKIFCRKSKQDLDFLFTLLLQEAETSEFTSFKDRLKHLQVNIDSRRV